jgi:hypothetical protein
MKTKTYVWKNGLKQLLTNWLPYEGLYSSPLLSLILFFLEKKVTIWSIFIF